MNKHVCVIHYEPNIIPNFGFDLNFFQNSFRHLHAKQPWEGDSVVCPELSTPEREAS